MPAVNAQMLNDLIESKGWTKVAFKTEVGISLSYLSDILSGKRGCTLERNPELRRRMAKALNVPTSVIELPIEEHAS